MSLHLIHGCTSNWAADQQSCRNFVPEERLCRFLEEQPRKYSRWQGNDEDEHILTVDDATQGAGRACELARTFGHEVMLFVNPYHVATGAPYFFSLLDAALDQRSVPVIRFLGFDYDLRKRSSLRAFRLVVKAKLCSVSYSASIAAVNELAEELGAGNLELKSHAQILSVVDLIRLRDLGVTIENHGWQHDEISYFDHEQMVEHLKRGEAWLSTALAVTSTHYAVPFGCSFVRSEERKLIPGPVWLAESELAEGNVGRDHWNRTEITSALQTIS